ncbi:GYF domain-containing protein [Bremerella sp.]|uniref:GYF domain-containing protein n=1 Tax=Bremerella sp. TaxID=2795602 RepID=UPI00391D7DF4
MKSDQILQKLGEIFPTLKPLLEKKKKKQYPGREKRKTPLRAPEPPKDAKPDLTEFYVKFPPKFQESGPYRLAELKTLARDGLITGETHIRTDKTSWMYARNIKGLVAAWADEE